MADALTPADPVPDDAPDAPTLASMDALTPKEQEFVLHYCGFYEDSDQWNGTAAARKAGYDGKGGTAKTNAWRLKHSPKVRRAIDDIIALRRRAWKEHLDRAMREMVAIAFSDITEVIDERGNLRANLPKRVRASIAEISRSVTKTGETARASYRVKMHSKVRALELIARMSGGIVERHQHSGPGNKAIPVKHSGTVGMTAHGVAQLYEAMGMPALVEASNVEGDSEEPDGDGPSEGIK